MLEDLPKKKEAVFAGACLLVIALVLIGVLFGLGLARIH